MLMTMDVVLVNSTDTFDDMRRQSSLLNDALTTWQTSKTGPLVNTILDHIGFARLKAPFVASPDTAAGPSSPHYEFIISVRFL